MDRGWTPLALGLLTIALAAASPGLARAAGDAAKGKTLYMANCVSCHGETGQGNGPVGQALNPPPRDFTKGQFKFDANGDGKPGEDADLELVITNGAAKYGGSPLMAPWGPQLPKSDIDDLIAYIRTLKK